MSDTARTRESGQALLRTDAERARYAIVAPLTREIRQLAHEALYEDGLPNDEFVLLCVDTCPRWKKLIEMLGPTENADGGNEDEDPVIIAIMQNDARDYIAAEFPNDASALYQPIPSGKARLIVIDQDGCLVFNIVPARISMH